MGIEEVSEIIGRIAGGIEDACARCLVENAGIVAEAIREQLYSGLDGDGGYLSPTYLEDDYFYTVDWYHEDENTGRKYIGARGYMEWKTDITPPVGSEMLGLPPRPEDVPNLYINGKFYSEITIAGSDDGLVTSVSGESAPKIVEKYGDRILNIGPTAVEYFNVNFMLPAIKTFFEDCGYR